MRLPKVTTVDRSRVSWFTIADTIEGWADALKVLIASYMDPSSEHYGLYVEFLYHEIRPEGQPLKTSGGKAPGHVPLKIGLEAVRALLQRAQGRQLRPIECHDICCHSALAVLSGGIRRSSLIALFSPDDAEMREAKSEANFALNPHRKMANNSAVFVRDKIDKDLFDEVFRVVRELGEPGFYFTNHPDHGCNPCGEIGMDPVLRLMGYNPQTGFSFCNLTEVNGTLIRTPQGFVRAARVAALLGTLQAGYTDFPYLGEVTEQIVRRDALIGVSITGVMDNEIVRVPEYQQAAAREVVVENERVARIIGINAAARATTGKPSGTASLSLGCIGSGHHCHEAPRYLRQIIANKLEPVFQKLRRINPHMCVEMPDGDWCISFPVEAPLGALTNDDIHGVEFIDSVLSTYANWIVPGTVDDNHGLTHNVSCTVIVEDGDWDAVRDHVWENRFRVASMAFAPRLEDTSYQFLPRKPVRTEADEARWNELIRKFQEVTYEDVRGDVEYGSACEGNLCTL
jgi:ribonucleoside-diphosphate reductase alpha chain